MLGMPDMYRQLEEESRHGRPVLVAHSLAFAARLAHETLGLPLVTVHLQPSGFYSIDDIPVTHPWLWSINDLPVELKRGLLTAHGPDSATGCSPRSPTSCSTIKKGRPPVRNIVRQWWHSPQRIIGLFPDPGCPRPDRTGRPNTVLTGFPLFDDEDEQPLRPDVTEFLDAGSHADRVRAGLGQSAGTTVLWDGRGGVSGAGTTGGAAHAVSRAAAGATCPTTCAGSTTCRWAVCSREPRRSSTMAGSAPPRRVWPAGARTSSCR